MTKFIRGETCWAVHVIPGSGDGPKLGAALMVQIGKQAQQILLREIHYDPLGGIGHGAPAGAANQCHASRHEKPSGGFTRVRGTKTNNRLEQHLDTFD